MFSNSRVESTHLEFFLKNPYFCPTQSEDKFAPNCRSPFPTHITPQKRRARTQFGLSPWKKGEKAEEKKEEDK